MEVLIVEDDPRIGEVLFGALKEFGYHPHLATDGMMALSMVRTLSFGCIICDIILPRLDGLGFCKLVRNEFPQIPILMLTALGSTDDKVEGFESGADDYLVKPFEVRELMARIKVLTQRYKPQMSTSTLTYADLTLHLYSKRAFRAGLELHLTPKEFGLLTFFLQNPERVLSRQEIAKAVWGTHFDTGTNFIDVYINYLRKKIEKGFPEKRIHTRPGMGFILQAE